jgi:hypothetical protein
MPIVKGWMEEKLDHWEQQLEKEGGVKSHRLIAATNLPFVLDTIQSMCWHGPIPPLDEQDTSRSAICIHVCSHFRM